MRGKPVWWPNRQSIRRKDLDYTAADAVYFVTVCSHKQQCIFGSVANEEMRLSMLGRLLEDELRKTPESRRYLEVGEYAVLPNHLHGLITFLPVSTDRKPVAEKCKTRGLQADSLGAIIGQFKSAVTKRARFIGFDGPLWQRGYYEHLVRDEDSLARIQEYISNNVLRWHLDSLNTGRTAEDPFEIRLKKKK